ncbi:MAG: ArsR/SmtB family transcription factor [Nitrososphaeria archaeon]
MPSGDRLQRRYRALGHPARKRIVELLGVRGRMQFSEIKAETSLSVGALYYHLDVLGDLVTQDDKRRYLLSEEGRNVYRSLVVEQGLPAAKVYGPTRFIPGSVFNMLGRSLPLSLSIWVAVAVLGGLASYLAGQVLVLLNFGVSIFPESVDVAFFPISMLAYSIYNLALVWVIAKRKTGVCGFFSSGMVFIPFLVFPMASILFSGLGHTVVRLLYVVLSLVIQVCGLVLGATYVSGIYGIRFERSLLLQLMFYLISTLLYGLLQVLGLLMEPWLS